MTVLVTGGLGFIGNEVVRQLLARGERVVVADNRNRVAPRIDDILAGAELPEADILDRQAMAALMEDIRPEVVIHMAAIHFIPECNADPERTLRVNVEGTSSVIEAAKKAGVNRVLFASSGAVYGDEPQALHEQSLIEPVDIYGYSKLFGEGLCRLHASAQFEIVGCRLFNNYGPRETNPHIIPEILGQLATGSRSLQLGNIQPVRDYIHTADTARAVLSLMQADLPQPWTPVNLCTGEGYSVQQLIEIIGELLGDDIRVERDEKRFRKVDKMVQLGDPSLLGRLTGWSPQWGIRDGLRDLLQFEGIAVAAGETASNA